MADIIVEALFRSMLFECYRIKATGCQWVPGNYLTGRWSRILAPSMAAYRHESAILERGVKQ